MLTPAVLVFLLTGWLFPGVTSSNHLSSPVAHARQSEHGSKSDSHTVTVKFDYDFKHTPACSAKVREKCVSEFVVYDISVGPEKGTKLMTIPVPDGATGLVRGITATTPSRVFSPGRHLISVTAADPSGVESGRPAASIWVVIP